MSKQLKKFERLVEVKGMLSIEEMKKINGGLKAAGGTTWATVYSGGPKNGTVAVDDANDN